MHTDQLGTPRYGTNSSGTQVWNWVSDAFGNGTPTGSVTVNLRLPGQYFDSESGLFYNLNRYYNPGLGRYITSDPIGLAGGPNGFLYAWASPLMYADPNGLAPDKVCLWVTTTCGTAFGGILGGAIGGGEGVAGGTLVAPGVGTIVGGVAGTAQGAVNGATVGAGVGHAVGGAMCPDANASSGPSGDCTPEEQNNLQDRVDNACKGDAAPACEVEDTNATLIWKIAMHSACIDARRNINNRCFKGGDTGHNKAIADRANAIAICQGYLSKAGTNRR